MVLIDTSVWIFALKRKPILEVKERVDTLLREELVATTEMIKFELLGGTKTEKEFRRLRNRLEALFQIQTDSTVWDKASELAFQLRKKGVTIPYTDVLIASASMSSQAVLMHADRHFDLIANYADLEIENLFPLIQK